MNSVGGRMIVTKSSSDRVKKLTWGKKKRSKNDEHQVNNKNITQKYFTDEFTSGLKLFE